jgi:hypothetical protein
MGRLFSKSNTVPSVPTPEKPQSSPPIAIPDGTTSTPSPRPGTASASAIARSQSTTLSHRRHDDGRDYPPPSSGGDVLTSQHPDRQSPQPTSIPDETTSTPSPRPGTASARAIARSQSATLSQRRHDDGRDYPPPSSGGASQPSDHQSPQRTSIPDGTTSTRSRRPGSASARTIARSQSATLSQRRHDDGGDYPPPSSGDDVFISQHPDRQEMRSRQYPSDGLSSATSQIPAGRQGGRSRFPFALQSLLPNDFRFAVGRCPIRP